MRNITWDASLRRYMYKTIKKYLGVVNVDTYWHLYRPVDKQDNIIYTCVLDIIADEFSSMFGTKINATTIEAQANYGVCPYTVISRSVINNYFYNKHAALSVGFINNFHVEGIK